MKVDPIAVSFRCASRLFAMWLLASLCSHALAQQENKEVTPEVKQLFAQAKAEQEHGDSAKAIEKYKATIELAPHLAPAYHNLGMLYFNEHDYSHAAEALERGIELNPSLPNESAILGISYFHLGEKEKAEPFLRAALSANPTDDNVEMILVNVLINLKNYEEAASILKSFLARNPKSQQGWYLLGKTYMQMSGDA